VIGTLILFSLAATLTTFDSYYLLLSTSVLIALQLPFFFITAIFTSFADYIFELSYGFSFIILSTVTLVANETLTLRKLFVTIAVGIWGIRLIGHLFLRLRVVKSESDSRFDVLRNNPQKQFLYFMFQLITVWVNSLPIPYINAYSITGQEELFLKIYPVDFFAASLFLAGFFIEVIADHQKLTDYSLHSKFEKTKYSQYEIFTGLWRYSRHPNYFGEILLWWGLGFFTIPTLGLKSMIALIGPLHTTLALLFFAGILTPNKVPPDETAGNQRVVDVSEQQKRAYRSKTSLLIPFPFRFCVASEWISRPRVGFGLGMCMVATGEWF